MFSAVVVSSRVEPGRCHLLSLDIVLCLALSLSRPLRGLVLVSCLILSLLCRFVLSLTIGSSCAYLDVVSSRA